MNSYGTLFKVTLYGESHQPSIGVVIDGMPPGIVIDEETIHADLAQRKPGATGTTTRHEDDAFVITAGVFNGRSTGSPIHLMIENKNVQSKDYEHLKQQPRPGHADFVAGIKYQGFQDYRGGGRFSGRLTAALVAAGSFAKMFTPYQITHTITQIGTLTDMSKLDTYLREIAEQGDSVGGIVELKVSGLSVGLGEPFFQKLDAELAKMLFSVPAVKGVEFGTGFAGVNMMGSEFNDVMVNGYGKTKTNHSGGVTGGLSNGNDLIIRVFVKPPSSISKPQDTYDDETKAVKPLVVGGRHDVAIVRRIGIVLENVVAIVLADMYLMDKAYHG